MLVGEKRYVLLPPTACSDLSLLPYGHPSARHSNITLAQVAAYATAEDLSDQTVARSPTKPWSDPDRKHNSLLAPNGNGHLDRYLDAHALDVHLTPGDVLHLPAYVFIGPS